MMGASEAAAHHEVLEDLLHDGGHCRRLADAQVPRQAGDAVAPLQVAAQRVGALVLPDLQNKVSRI